MNLEPHLVVKTYLRTGGHVADTHVLNQADGNYFGLYQSKKHGTAYLWDKMKHKILTSFKDGESTGDIF